MYYVKTLWRMDWKTRDTVEPVVKSKTFKSLSSKGVGVIRALALPDLHANTIQRSLELLESSNRWLAACQ